MHDAYGIFTPDGEALGGTLTDEYALRLAERLDESSASLYISTKHGVLLMGTAVNVQKQGRRPDTVIYLERTVWEGGPVPAVDRSAVHAFFERVERRLAAMEYALRDVGPEIGAGAGLVGARTTDYALGRLLLGRPVVCTAGIPSRSYAFFFAVLNALQPLLSTGFTFVIAKRIVPDIDLVVAETAAGRVQVDLATETVTNDAWEEMYRDIGRFSRNPVLRQILAGASSHPALTGSLLAEYTHANRVPPGGKNRFAAFLAEEGIPRAPKPPEGGTPGIARPPEERPARPDEADYAKPPPRPAADRLEQEYAVHMEQKRTARRRLAIGVGVVLVLMGAILVLFLVSPGLLPLPLNGTPAPHITPSAPITPEQATVLITRLNTTPGNIPADLQGVGSAYDITVAAPQNVTLELTADISTERFYSLMRYNASGAIWEPVETPLVVTNKTVVASIPTSGIYRVFTNRTPPQPQG